MEGALASPLPSSGSSELGKCPGLVAGELDLRAWDWILFSDCTISMGTKCAESERVGSSPLTWGNQGGGTLQSGPWLTTRSCAQARRRTQWPVEAKLAALGLLILGACLELGLRLQLGIFGAKGVRGNAQRWLV